MKSPRCGPIAVAGLAAVRVAAADPEPIRITYDAPSECPAESALIAELGQHARFARVEAADARVFGLAIVREDSGFHGELVVQRGGEVAAKREVSAASCDEVFTALVLVAALAVEEATPPRPSAVQAAPSSPRPATPPERELPWRLELGAGVARYSGVTPSVRFGVPIYLAASHGRQQARATFDTTGSDDLAVASFRWTAGRIDGCPYAWSLGRLAATPCIGLQIGALTGKGTTLDHAASETRPWIAPDLVARLAVQVGRAHFEVEGTLAAPIERDRYYVGMMTTVHRVAALSEGVATTVAIQFR
jgi:hypothetical protein